MEVTRVAVLSFLPDAGHVFPLLRIAASFSERGHEVVCYLPQECEKYLNGYDFRFVSLGPALSETAKADYRKMLLRLSQKSIFYNAFAGGLDLSEGYWDPLMSKAKGRLASLERDLVADPPLFLLCDDHVLKELYRTVSKDLGIPLVLHTFEGHRRHQNLYVHTYGISGLSKYIQLGLDRAMHAGRLSLLGAVHISRGASVMLHSGRRPRRIGQSSDATTSYDATKPGFSIRPIAISTGSGYLEQSYLSSELITREEHRFFGPLRTKSLVRLSPELRTWLEMDEPVVYVSFGSMVHLDVDFVKAILTGLSRLSLRVLWSMPRVLQDELLRDLDVPESVRFPEFVPPLEVLSMKSVRCGINHGGAGSMQDCLLSGKPMLIIPIMWDQPYNGSVVASLGVGKRLWRKRVSAETVGEAVEPLVHDDRFASRAASLAAELERHDSESKVVEYILSQPAIRDRARAAGSTY